MLTLGTTAPLASVTVPTIVAVVWARPAAETSTITRDRSRLFLSRILPSPGKEFATAYHGRGDTHILDRFQLARAGAAAAKTPRLLPPGRPLGLLEDTFMISPTCATAFSLSDVIEPPPSRLRAL